MEGGAAPMPAAVEERWGSTGLRARTFEIPSAPDENTITLDFRRPDTDELLPLVIHLHGGGMAVDSTFTPRIQRRINMLAHCGVAVVSVDFRNYYLPSVPGAEVKQFPAGTPVTPSATSRSPSVR